MNIKKMIVNKKHKNVRPGSKLGSFLGVTIHNTGNNGKGADALAHAKLLQNGGGGRTASWHYCVDKDVITQSIPENEMAWHAGDGRSGKGNSKTIGIEICMNSDGDLKVATNNAAVLAADILYRRGVKEAKSGKNIFQHHDFTGKNCPQKIRTGKPYSWVEFVKRVNQYLDKKWGVKQAPKTKTKKQKLKDKAKKYAEKRKTIRRGSNGAEVKKLQRLLKKLDLYKGKIDGIFGSQTEAALIKAQRKYNLDPDGICGPKSWAEIYYRTLI